MNQMMQEDPMIALIQSCWHFDIVDQYRVGMLTELDERGHLASMVRVFQVPGAFDIPLLTQTLATTGAYKAIVASGFVVDGGIYRHDFVAGAVIDALMRVQLDTSVPVISTVLTPHHFQETDPHISFFKDHFVLKGREAARAALQIMGNFDTLKQTAA